MASTRHCRDVILSRLQAAEGYIAPVSSFTSPRMTSFLVSLAVLLCSSSLLSQSRPEARHIPSGPYRIAGTIVNAKTGDPIARARVTIEDVKNRRKSESVVTSDNGRFEFHVNAGKFALQGSKRGYITSGYEQHDQYWTAIVTGAGLDTENLVFRLPPAAVLAGKVLDETGEPVRNARIGIYREDRFSGVSRIGMLRTAQTDDQGQYEATPLPAGTYFVSVTAQPWYAVHHVSASDDLPSMVDRSLDATYPLTYYGDVTESEDATPIPVRGGDRLEADIHLSPVPALHLTFQVPDDGRNGINTPVLEKPAFDGMERAESYDIERVSPGVYEMTGVAAGRYVVRMPDSPGQLKEPAEVDLTSGQELEVSGGNSTGKVTATVQVAGDPGLPAGLQLVLRNAKGRMAGRAEADATTGEFVFNDVPSGRYVVLAASPNKAYSVIRIGSADGVVSGHTLDVPAGASLTVSLSLAGGSAAIEGFAKRGNKPAAGAMIVLVPTDPEANQELFRRDQSDLDGSFSLQDVIPGAYTVIAIHDGWDLDWAKPAVLAAYLKYGQTIVIPSQSRGSVPLPKPVELVEK